MAFYILEWDNGFRGRRDRQLLHVGRPPHRVAGRRHRGHREGHDRLAGLPRRQPVDDHVDDAGDGRALGSAAPGRSAGSRRRSRARWASSCARSRRTPSPRSRAVTLGTMALFDAAYRSFRRGHARCSLAETRAEAVVAVSSGPFSLDGRVAFVTGAGGGLGEGICTSLAAAGAAVACADIDADRAERIARAGDGGGRPGARLCTWTSPTRASVRGSRGANGRGTRGVDVLVNNAAIYPRRAWTEITEEEWDRVLAVNLKSYFLCARACHPSMKERGGGHIVNVSSITFMIGFEHAARLRLVEGCDRRLHPGAGA